MDDEMLEIKRGIKYVIKKIHLKSLRMRSVGFEKTVEILLLVNYFCYFGKKENNKYN